MKPARYIRLHCRRSGHHVYLSTRSDERDKMARKAKLSERRVPPECSRKEDCPDEGWLSYLMGFTDWDSDNWYEYLDARNPDRERWI